MVFKRVICFFPLHVRHFSAIDTLAIARQLEVEGVPSNKAAAITNVLCKALEEQTNFFVTKLDLKNEQEKYDAGLKVELFRANYLKSHLKLCASVEKSHSVLRSNLEKSIHVRHFSAKPTVTIDTLAATHQLEVEGEKAEVVTNVFTKVLAEQKEMFLSKLNLKILQENSDPSLKVDMGKIRADYLKSHAELCANFEKSLAALQTDLEKSHAELRVEFGALKTNWEATKFEIGKYFIGSFVSVSAIAFSMMRLFM